MDIIMNINFLLVIIIIILAIGIMRGWKRGILESVIRIISCILGILVLVIVAKGIGNFIQGSYVNVLMALILLLLIRIIHKIVSFVLDTFKLVRAIPVGKIVDKLAGAVLGAVEAVFMIWFAFLLIGSFDIMNINSWVIKQVSQSSLLTALYYSNYLVQLLKHLI